MSDAAAVVDVDDDAGTVVEVPSSEPIPAPVPSAVMPSAPISEEMVDLDIPFIAIDGSPAHVTLGSGSLEEARKTAVLASCCPCFVGGITSPERVAELKNLLKRFTFWAIVIQLVMFFVSVGCSGGFADFEENALLGPSAKGLVNSGAKYTFAILHGGIHRLLVPLLLHADVIHLSLNIWAELVICMYAEYTLHGIRLGLIFIASGLGATILSAIVSPDVISVGASGGVMGVMAVLFVNTLFERETTDPLRLSMIRSLTVSMVVMLLMSFIPFVDFASHLGGLIVGFGIGMYYWGAHGIKVLARYPTIQKIFPYLIALALTLYFVIIIIVLAVATPEVPLFGESSSSF